MDVNANEVQVFPARPFLRAVTWKSSIYYSHATIEAVNEVYSLRNLLLEPTSGPPVLIYHYSSILTIEEMNSSSIVGCHLCWYTFSLKYFIFIEK